MVGRGVLGRYLGAAMLRAGSLRWPLVPPPALFIAGQHSFPTASGELAPLLRNLDRLARVGLLRYRVGSSLGELCVRSSYAVNWDPRCSFLSARYSIGGAVGCRAFSSSAAGDQSAPLDAVQNAANEGSGGAVSSASGDDLIDIFERAHQSVKDAVLSAGKSAKELADQAFPHLQQFYGSQPYMEKVIIPTGGTLIATMLAWLVMPRILRKLHKYSSHSPFALLAGSAKDQLISYEKSVWNALEDPARYLITFMAFSQLGAIIAPTTAQYLPQAWRGALVLSFVWFLHRWKTNFFAGSLTNQLTIGVDRDRLLAMEKLSSVGLIVLGAMAVAEAFGVPVQSIITVGGIGGVATAFAARDILGNFFSGLSLQFTKPFSVGDNIKAGSVEGQVTEIGLTSTSLISPEKFPVVVPNSLFSSQVIVNKSRAQWRSSLNKIPVRIDDIEKIPIITQGIRSMLGSHPKVFLEKDAPYCYLSRIEYSFAELTLGCNLRSMRKDELLAAEQDILLQAASIIRQHGAELGVSLPLNY